MKKAIVILFIGFLCPGIAVVAQPHIPGFVIIHTPGIDGYFQVCFQKRCVKNARSGKTSRQSNKARRKWKRGAKKRKRIKLAQAKKRRKSKEYGEMDERVVKAPIDHSVGQAAQIVSGVDDQEPAVVDEIPLNEVIRFKWVYFKNDEWSLSDSGKAELSDLVHYMNIHSSVNVEILAHTDNAGAETYNISLSGKRALAVHDYIMSMGISQLRIKWKAYGESKPVVPNTEVSNKALNRRVEYMLY